MCGVGGLLCWRYRKDSFFCGVRGLSCWQYRKDRFYGVAQRRLIARFSDEVKSSGQLVQVTPSATKARQQAVRMGECERDGYGTVA